VSLLDAILFLVASVKGIISLVDETSFLAKHFDSLLGIFGINSDSELVVPYTAEQTSVKLTLNDASRRLHFTTICIIYFKSRGLIHSHTHTASGERMTLSRLKTIFS
jgi:hypothetical protein